LLSLLLCLGLAPLARAQATPAGVRPPVSIVVTTPRGETRIQVRAGGLAGPSLPGKVLLAALNGSLKQNAPWVELTVARQTFDFLLGAPFMRFNDRTQPLSGWAWEGGDSLFLPLQFVTELLPQLLAERYTWDAGNGRLKETGPAIAAPRARAPAEKRLANGLLPGHVVTVDAGHGGIDPGNPGIFFPRGISEKHVTLQVALLLRQELKERGVKVVMTRTTDTLIGFRDRARFCIAECDLFVSLHVDALPKSARNRYRSVSGFHTIIIGEENTEDADRIARMENEALRFEDDTAQAPTEGLEFILGNLQMNEYLRESARAAELVQDNVSKIHTGTNRGVKQSKVLAVLNQARRPAILVEMGFSTNPEDARIMSNRKSQEAMASAIADAIVDYLRDYERKTGSPGGAP
jgi:N-acetylmuramoyl-L-alanine amidase